ncbi:hypothetical protein MHYP_G00065810 [Metynnis hypsauchen]
MFQNKSPYSVALIPRVSVRAVETTNNIRTCEWRVGRSAPAALTAQQNGVHLEQHATEAPGRASEACAVVLTLLLMVAAVRHSVGK